MLIVGKNEYFKTIQSALDCVTDEDNEIYIRNGIYHEKLVINKKVHLIGENRDLTIISNSDYARKMDEQGRTLETFRTYTVLVLMDEVSIVNISIRNDSGPGEQCGQAVALFVNANQVRVSNCNIIAYQDTLLTGPIPKDAKNQEYLNFDMDHHAMYIQHYVNCKIQGDVDFIFGSANAIFKRCKIVSNNLNKEINGYISAPSTEEGHLGHVFIDCELISDANAESVYLGRSWREHASAVFINCYMGAHIHRQAFAKWDQKHLKSRFYEYGSYGQGAYREDALSKVLEKEKVQKYIDLTYIKKD